MEAGQPRVVPNQPYDESLELNDSEDITSLHSPTPRTRAGSGKRSSQRLRGAMATAHNSSSEDLEEKPKHLAAISARTSNGEEDDSEEEEDSEDEDSDEDDGEQGSAPEGAYDPADYDNLPVSTEIRELFQYITRYNPQSVELDHRLKPFIPDFIPAVGDIDAFLKVPRPDGKPDDLGLLVLDEPCVSQSDPTVLSLWLSEETKQHHVTEVKKVSSVADAQKNPKALDSWMDSIWQLHRAKPPASVQYGGPAPDLEALMQEWPGPLEELLGTVALPSAQLDCSLAQYGTLVCALLDVPLQRRLVHSLHLLFSLYLEFRDSQHFNPAAKR